jgi:acetyltransferase-like isoleucine patch superfamily enzyme
MQNLAAAVPVVKSGPTCVSGSIELEAEAKKTLEIGPFDIINDEQQKEKHAANQFFSSLLRSKNVSHPKRRPRFKDPLELLPRGLIKLYSMWLSLTYPFASKGRNVSFHFTSHVDRQRAVRISLGNSISLRKDAWLNVATEDPTGEPVIVIDDNCHIGYGSIISAKNRIHIERDVLVAQQVLIVDHNHAYEDITIPIAAQGITGKGKIRIGQGSWIGRGAAIISPRGELTIGRNCVVAVNSVVTRSIPDYCVVFGSPATIIKQYNPQTQAWCIGPKENTDARIHEELTAPIGE